MDGAKFDRIGARLSEDDAPDAPESPGDASVTDEQTTNASPSDAAPRRDRFFFARTTVASRSRAETRKRVTERSRDDLCTYF